MLAGKALYIVLSAVAIVVSDSSRLPAQPSLPMSCEAATRALSSDDSNRRDVVIASRRIVRCGDVAPGTLMAILRFAAEGSVRDTVGREAAWVLSDRRLLDSVIALSNDRSVSVSRRTVALALLTHYADSLASLLPGMQHDAMPLVIAHRIHGGYIPGGVPMDAADQVRALDAIRRVAAEEPDSELRLLARLAAEQLDLRRKERPLPH